MPLSVATNVLAGAQDTIFTRYRAVSESTGGELDSGRLEHAVDSLNLASRFLQLQWMNKSFSVFVILGISCVFGGCVNCLGGRFRASLTLPGLDGNVGEVTRGHFGGEACTARVPRAPG
jgi:hypothetical protein